MRITSPLYNVNKDKKEKENEGTSSTDIPLMDNVKVSKKTPNTNHLQAIVLGRKYSRRDNFELILEATSEVPDAYLTKHFKNFFERMKEADPKFMILHGGKVQTKTYCQRQTKSLKI